MKKEYDFSKGVRGKYAKRYTAGTNLVALAPDVASVFSQSGQVNSVLRMIIKIVKHAPNKAVRK